MTKYLNKISRQNIQIKNTTKDFCHGFINSQRIAESETPQKKDKVKLSQSCVHNQATISSALNKAIKESENNVRYVRTQMAISNT